jgi:hypothetical protein
MIIIYLNQNAVDLKQFEVTFMEIALVEERILREVARYGLPSIQEGD